MKLGTHISVFTGGVFRHIGKALQSVVEPFTNGWYTTFDDLNGEHTTQYIRTLSAFDQEGYIGVSDSIDYLDFSMLPSQYVKKCTSDWDGARELQQVLTQDYVLRYGVPVEYYRVTYEEDKSAVDMVWGENINRYVIKMYDNIMSWHKLQRESRIWGMFGIESDDSIKMMIPKAHFEFETDGYYPQSGDIIREKPTGRLFEILEREEGESIGASFLQSKQYMWEVKAVIYKRQENIGFVPATAGTELARILSLKDKLDVTNVVEATKDDVLYAPTRTDQSSQIPYVGW